jgi:Domain of unknown function (DUF4360)
MEEVRNMNVTPFTRHTRRITIAVAAVGALTLPAPATPAAADLDVPPPSDVSIDVMKWNGCRDGRVVIGQNNDRTVITTYPTEFRATSGGSAPPTAFRKTCFLTYRIKAPSSYTYAVSGHDTSGYADLEPGATGQLRSSHYVQGSSQTVRMDHALNGPYHDTWWFSGRIPEAERAYKPCDEERNLVNIVELRANQGTSDPARTNTMEISQSTQGKITHYISWKRCRD